MVMGTVTPDSEALRRAIKWISNQLKENDQQNPRTLLENAALRFNLSPRETQFIYQFYKNNIK
jgi:hypothetical protein